MQGRRSFAVLLCSAAVACAGSRANLFTDPRAGDALRAELAANPGGTVAAVHRVWTEYIESKAGGFDCGPSQYWVDAEQGTFTMPDGRSVPVCYDLAGSMLDARMSFTVLRIDPVDGAAGVEYRVTTRFALDGARPVIVTVFAVREGPQWKLAGALGRLTRMWRRERVGPFTYIVPPGRRFSRVRAELAVVFADSVARALGVPPLSSLRYYLVADGDAMLRVFGYQADTTYGTPGGRSMPGLIISGDSAFGENHGHEIVHHLMNPLQGPRLNIVASEGVPSWLGGSRGRLFPELVRALGDYLRARPSATLDTVLASNAHPMHNAGAALLAAMIHDRGGIGAIAQFLDCGPSLDEFKAGVARILGASWPEVAAEWRRRAVTP